MNSPNPQQEALNMLRQTQPQRYNQITQMMNSGVNPQQAMKELNINQNQINNIRNNFK